MGTFLVQQRRRHGVFARRVHVRQGTEQTEQMFGFAVTFSTVHAYARDRTVADRICSCTHRRWAARGCRARWMNGIGVQALSADSWECVERWGRRRRIK